MMGTLPPRGLLPGSCCPPPSSPPCQLLQLTLTDLCWLCLELGLGRPALSVCCSLLPGVDPAGPSIPLPACSCPAQSCLADPQGLLPASGIPLLDWNPGLSGAQEDKEEASRLCSSLAPRRRPSCSSSSLINKASVRAGIRAGVWHYDITFPPQAQGRPTWLAGW